MQSQSGGRLALATNIIPRVISMKLPTNFIVIDVEIANPVSELKGGWDNTAEAGVGLIGMYDSRVDCFSLIGPESVPMFQSYLISEAKDGTRIVTYNGYRHDFPVIFGKHKETWVADMVCPAWVIRTLESTDLLRQLWLSANLDPDVYKKETHSGFGLDAVAKANLGRGKNGRSEDAAMLLRQGKFCPVASYCLNDVALTRDLYLMAARGEPISVPTVARKLVLVNTNRAANNRA